MIFFVGVCLSRKEKMKKKRAAHFDDRFRVLMFLISFNYNNNNKSQTANNRYGIRVCVYSDESSVCACVRARAKNRRGRFTKQKITKVERAAIDICWRVTLELRFENRKNEKTAQTHKCNAIIFFSSGRAIVMMMMMIAVFDKKPMSNSHLCHHSLIKRLYHCIIYTPLPLSNRKTAIVRCIFPKLANTHLSND